MPLARALSVRFLTSLLAIVLACGLGANPQAARTSSADQSRHTISGTVVNSATGAPLPRALVTLNGESSRFVMTDAGGTFRFESVPDSFVHLEAEKPGFFKPDETSSDVAPFPSFQLKGDASGIVLTMVPQAHLSGHVLSSTGSPIENFPICLYMKSVTDGVVAWEKVANVNTDHEGYFSIFDMPEESIIVAAGPEHWRSRPRKGKNLGYPLVFYPNAREFSSASILSVVPGQELETNFSVSQEPLFELSGIVLGVPSAIDAQVELTTMAGDAVPLGQPHPEQHEFFGYVTPGQYLVRASAEVDGQTLRAAEAVTVSANTRIQLALASPQVIQVNLQTDSHAYDRNGPASTADVELISKATSIAPIRLSARQTPRHDGSVMEISGAEPGFYAVTITPDDGYVKTATSGSTDLLQNDLFVPENGKVAALEILLGFDGGSVEGSIKMGDHKRAAVLLVPASGSTRNIRTTGAIPTGHFLFEQVCPGDYLVLAFERVDKLEYKNPSVLGPYLPSGVHVTINPSQRATISLNVTEQR